MSHVTISPQLLYQRAAVRARDEVVFLGKLGVLAVLLAGGAVLALQSAPLSAVCGVVLLGAAYTHAVELQHQCLHHSAFRGARAHRLVGVPLGTPMLVSYSHYRVRHLQHHRFLGTPQDTEFFGFDTRRPLTPGTLAKALFDVSRLFMAVTTRPVPPAPGSRHHPDAPGRGAPRTRGARQIRET